MATDATDGAGEAAGDAAGTGGKRTRLIIDITPALRRRIRLAAAREDVSVREYVEEILQRAVPEEQRLQEQPRRRMTAADAERLRLARDELARAHPGADFGDVVEEIRRMREERTAHLERVLRGE